MRSPMVGQSCAADLTWVSTRPDPFTVDATDPRAILIFINAQVPFAREKHPWALRTAAVEFWSLYRPDLAPEDLARRFDAFDLPKIALALIRETRAPTSAATRLVRWWARFLADLTPQPPRVPMMTVAPGDDPAADVRTGNVIIAELLRNRANMSVNSTYAMDRLFAAYWADRWPHRPLPVFPTPLHHNDYFFVTRLYSGPAARRVIAAWQTLVDVDRAIPDTKPAPRATRADVINVPSDSRSIQLFLIRHYPDEPADGRHLIGRLIERAYAENAPDQLPRVPRSVPPGSYRPLIVLNSDQAIEERWRMFIADVIGESSATPASTASYADEIRTHAREFESKHLESVPRTIGEVKDDAHSIIGFLLNRYRRVKLSDPGALSDLFELFRHEHELPKSSRTFAPQALRSAFYRRHKGTTDEVRAEWRDIEMHLLRYRRTTHQ